MRLCGAVGRSRPGGVIRDPVGGRQLNAGSGHRLAACDRQIATTHFRQLTLFSWKLVSFPIGSLLPKHNVRARGI